VLAVLWVSLLIVSLDDTILNIALPALLSAEEGPSRSERPSGKFNAVHVRSSRTSPEGR
jgi:hypothetical protein